MDSVPQKRTSNGSKANGHKSNGVHETAPRELGTSDETIAKLMPDLVGHGDHHLMIQLLASIGIDPCDENPIDTALGFLSGEFYTLSELDDGPPLPHSSLLAGRVEAIRLLHNQLRQARLDAARAKRADGASS